MASARARGRSLQLTFTHATAGLTLNAGEPLLQVSGSGARLPRRGKAAAPVRVRITDTQGTVTTVNVR